jgi:hypothetical protein
MPKVAFVLGAGASRHLGFPAGSELIDDIIATLSRDCPLADAINSIYGGKTAQSLADEIAGASLVSIDQFMRIQRDDTLRNACRLTIAYKILEAEYRSTAKMRDRTLLWKNWYHLFRQFLLDNPRLANPGCFCFLSFNYDRSFEHFLRRALAVDAKIAPTTSVSFPEVFHLHGSLGVLPGPSSRDSLEYGGTSLFRFDDSPLEYVNPRPLVLNPTQARTVANQIAFPHDEVKYGIGNARMLAEVDLMVVIGFGFAPENREKIMLRVMAEKGVPIVASSLGLLGDAPDYVASLPGIEQYSQTSDVLFDKVLRKRLTGLFGTT